MTEQPYHPNGPPPPPPPSPEAELVLVGFKGHRLEVYQNPDRLPLSRGDAVIVEVERGLDLGIIHRHGRPEIRRKPDSEPWRIMRPATDDERAKLSELRSSDPQALAAAKDRIAYHGLPMHLVDAEQQFDGHRVTFFFTADHRIDFRELVRDLAGIFRTRIELRQIGTREAARRLGGLGTCGRAFCCSCVLCGFERVSLQAAREQKLALSPVRLSGVCGRLLCCLNFETEEDPCASAESWGCGHPTHPDSPE